MSNEKPYQLKMNTEELISRAAQTNPQEAIDVARGAMPKATIESLIDQFEKSSYTEESGEEFWYARELQGLLGYDKWQTFSKVIDKAKISCENFGSPVENHFTEVSKMVSIGSNTERPIEDLKLDRYGCYLIAQNADPRKRPVAFAQTYFAIQTRRQELTDRDGVNFDSLSEDQKRLYMRNQVVEQNKLLARAAKGVGVTDGKDFSIFQAKGYQGLYGGRNVKEIAAYKNLPKNAKILDHMGSAELAANLFRITQTEEKLRKDDSICTKAQANFTHYEVGKQVREAMQQISGTLPEDLPAAPDVKKIAKGKKQGKIQERATIQIESKPIDLKNDIWKYALLIMAQKSNHQISTTELIAELPKYITIPEKSLEILEGRKDSKFSQLVRNLKSHKTSKTNFIHKGYAKDIRGGFELTDKGFHFVISEFKDRL